MVLNLGTSYIPQTDLYVECKFKEKKRKMETSDMPLSVLLTWYILKAVSTQNTIKHTKVWCKQKTPLKLL
jgi:hypothetical protein